MSGKKAGAKKKVAKKKAPKSAQKKKPEKGKKILRRQDTPVPSPKRKGSLLTHEPGKRKIVVEACKSAPIFKSKAEKLFSIIEERSPGDFVLAYKVDRPRKGTFMVSVDNKIFVQLLQMESPYQLLEDLDLEELGEKSSSTTRSCEASIM
eukprot:gene285-1182_t